MFLSRPDPPVKAEQSGLESMTSVMLSGQFGWHREIKALLVPCG
ncbi:hypothetical protein [Paenibacillus polymyxa]|nr:hypothetical protein [Paenibacillus polymyxa]